MYNLKEPDKKKKIEFVENEFASDRPNYLYFLDEDGEYFCIVVEDRKKAEELNKILKTI